MKSRRRMSDEDKKIVESEIRKTFAEYDIKNVRELEAITLWALHDLYGFGPKRLRAFYDRFLKDVKGLVARYQMEDQDMDWLATRKLKEIGVDLDEWRRELKEDAE